MKRAKQRRCVGFRVVVGAVVMGCIAAASLGQGAAGEKPESPAPVKGPEAPVPADEAGGAAPEGVPAGTVAMPPKYEIPVMSPETQARFEAMKAAMDAKWCAIKSLEVRFAYDLREESTEMIGRFKEHVVLEGAKRYLDQRHGMNVGPTSGRLHRFTTIFADGKTHECNFSAGQVSVESGSRPTADLVGSGFFSMNWLRVPSEAEQGPEARPFCDPLESMSEYCKPVLRADREVFEGVECEVLEFRSEWMAEPLSVIWLDPARGFLPFRSIHTLKPNGEWHMECRILECIEVIPGVWLGTRAIQSVDDSGMKMMEEGKVVELSGKRTYDMVVEKDERGAWLLRVNHEVPAERFVPQVPDGFRQFDADAIRRGQGVPVAPQGR